LTLSKKEKLINIYNALSAVFGKTACPLVHSDPLQLLVAVILSSQCTDARVNMITPVLFKRFKNVYDFASAPQSELEKYIRTAGFFRMKSKNIIASCRKIVESYGGQVPSTMEALTSLPGVGRKSANVVLGNAFGIPGFPVDTHVIRLSKRIGIVKNIRDPVKIEAVVTKNIQDSYWTEFSHLLIFHGRKRCTARKPDCLRCEIRIYCDTGKKVKI